MKLFLSYFKISEYLGWSTYWRVSTIITGAVMLLLLPELLNSDDLALVYVLYSSFGAVALVDFGLTNKIFIVGFKNDNRVFKSDMVYAIFIRLTLLIISYTVYSFFLNDFSILSLSRFFSGVIYSLIAVLVFVTLFYQSYYEGNIDSKLVYVSKTIGELAGILFLIGSLILNLGFLSILIFFISKSVTSLIILLLYYDPKVIDFDSNNIVVERRFTWKLGLVMAIGYFSGLGLLNIVYFFFDAYTSAAFSQLYLVGSTLFGFCMSIALYKQKEIKFFKVENSINDFKKLKIDIQIKVERTFILCSIILLAAVFCLSFLEVNWIKFNILHLILILIFFYFLINNHMAAIFSRVKGKEILFPVSIFGGLSIIVITFLIGFYLKELYWLLLAFCSLSYLLNNLVTNYYFNEFLYSIKKEL